MRKYISQRSFEVIPMSYNTGPIKLLQLCQVFALANRSRIFYSKRKWLMPGVTCYSIQTLSIYAKKHRFYSGIKLLVFIVTRKTQRSRPRKERVKCTVKCASGSECIVIKYFLSIYFTLHCFTTVSTLRSTGNEHSICIFQTTTKG